MPSSSSKKGKTLSLSEPPLESSEGSKPPSDWPQKGRLEFRNVTLRYFAMEAPALDNLSFTIREGEKIGIVGKLKCLICEEILPYLIRRMDSIHFEQEERVPERAQF